MKRVRVRVRVRVEKTRVNMYAKIIHFTFVNTSNLHG